MLYLEWDKLQIYGRTYVSIEGVNAQLSIPEHNWEQFSSELKEKNNLNNILKNAVACGSYYASGKKLNTKKDLVKIKNISKKVIIN